MGEPFSIDDVDRDAYGELRDSLIFIQRNEQLSMAIEKIQKSLDVACQEYKNYGNFTFEEKARYDALLAYSVNSLIWMYQKLTGATELADSIKHELGRVKVAMERTKEVHESVTERPRLDQQAAKRFIRAGLYDANKPEKSTDTPPNKKIRFDD
ncbi:hypothetical protein ZHAS_00017046 [Anopheles sinensis]|uniref:Nuclear nucleic acid-binding protein C1D n=1 Tax=Anopheles sinensis TaxID=74873 RepID=A0A084WFP1_ANOSI|nr:hypothetical protein ZHAS_00017046 [Anopheles sinensis]